ncbi:FitA-like ribbon-helix-helix domain-containing protein [Lactococcus garvieae]|uniref:FitA-like ribbon-helix-helix domain-containing protein n=1 Tax=Lactococcus garvieae TaxID=1363 RepID=UPI003853007A
MNLDLIIRDLPDNFGAALKAIAKRQGISQEEYLRRMIQREVSTAGEQLVLDSESKIRLTLAQALERNAALMEIIIQIMEDTNGKQN